MIAFRLNGQATTYDGDPAVSLLSYLRNDRHLTAAKDGCSGQAACGACLVELNGKACLACSTPMSKVTDGDVVTLEGLPETLRRTLGMAFVNRRAVQCGFCTPGFLMRAKVLLQTNPNPTREEVVKAVRPHLCRCTGYVKLVDAILDAATLLPEGNIPEPDDNPRLGSGWPKYGGYERAVGTRPFVNDIDAPGMAHGAIVFSEHPRARVLAIHTDEAADMPGVVRILTADDIPGERVLGLYAKDWPVYIKVGEVTRYIGDALACVVAETEAEARAAAACVKVDYEVLTPLLDMEEAETSPIHIHENGNILLDKSIRRGEPVDEALARCAFTAEATYRTQAVEHAFIEPEATLAVPEAGGVRLYVQSQGIWHDKTDIAALLHVPTPKVTVTLADSGGVGLAAPQVGVLRRVCVVLDEEDQLIELVNPEIIYTEGEQTGLEGCLSVPGKYGVVTRPEMVRVRAQDRDGQWFEVEDEGLTARCFCHELAHLDGHLYTELTDRLYDSDELDELMEDRSGRVKDGEDNPILRENRTVIAISAQLGALYACVWTLQDMPHGEQLGGGYLLPLFGNIVMLALCSMWMVWNLSCELDLDRRRNNLKIELRYMLAQLLLTVLSFYFHLGLAGFLLSIAILLFYLRVINPRYMGRKLWWKKPKRAVCKMKKGSRDGS